VVTVPSIIQDAKLALWRAFRAFDLDIRRHSKLAPELNPEDPFRVRLLRDHGVTVVLDVGASSGQYAMALRAAGYRGRIASFEPLEDAFLELKSHAERESQWKCFRIALGERDGRGLIRRAGNSLSSSILPMLPTHVEAAPDSKEVGTASVDIRRLDSVAAEVLKSEDRVWLKLDVQGYEREVLDGAVSTVRQVVAMEVEMSLVPLYEGQDLLPKMVESLQAMDFSLVGLYPVFVDPRNGHMLQVNGILVRSDSAGTAHR